MTGRKESKLEKILRPLRLNPVGTVLAGLGVGAHLVNSGSEDVINQIGQVFAATTIYTGIILSLLGTPIYFQTKSKLQKHGFDRRYAKTQMKHYCNRQALYVASIEKGYREEVNQLIKETPEYVKYNSWAPHI